MSKKIGLIILFQLCLLLNSVFAAGVTVAIDEQVKVEGRTLFLGQIAKISGGDEETNQNLRELKIGDAPVPGGSFVLTKDVIYMRIAATGTDVNSITWLVPNYVTVIGNSQNISAQTLINKGIEAIRSQVGPNVDKDDLSIVFIGRGQDVIAPVGNVTLVSSLPYGIRYNTPATVTISVNANEQAVSKVVLKFNVKLYSQVAVAARHVDVHEIFTEDSLRYERMDTGRISAGFVTDTSKIIGRMARRAITPGMVILDSMVNKPMLVKRGNVVVLVALLGNLEVTASGQAMQDGYEGQLIRIKNASSNKIVLGKVVDKNRVQVLTP